MVVPVFVAVLLVVVRVPLSIVGTSLGVTSIRC